jgi:hypothetical protein
VGIDYNCKKESYRDKLLLHPGGAWLIIECAEKNSFPCTCIVKIFAQKENSCKKSFRSLDIFKNLVYIPIKEIKTINNKKL